MTFKQLRVNAGFTQGQIAERLNVTAECVNQWENGKRKPKDMGQLLEIAKLLNVSVDEIIKLFTRNKGA